MNYLQTPLEWTMRLVAVIFPPAGLVMWIVELTNQQNHVAAKDALKFAAIGACAYVLLAASVVAF